MRPISLSDDFREFLERRRRMHQADREIALKFQTALVSDDPSSHDYFAMRITENGPRITYLTNDRAKLAPGEEFDRYALRYAGKPSKVAQRITGIESGNALAVFTNALVAAMTPPPPVTLVRGEEIDTYFPESGFCSCPGRRLGALGTSCMRPNRYVAENRFQLWKDVAELAVIACPVCQGTLGRCVVLTDDETGAKRHSYVYAGDEIREAMNDYFAAHDIRLASSEETWFRVEADSRGYAICPSTDAFRYCSACKTLGSQCCQGADRSWGYSDRDYRACTPHTKTFPRGEKEGQGEEAGAEMDNHP